jgi:NAD(P)-dependent dehydrogenase (short-subunit alcohol dehydrogenase family)
MELGLKDRVAIITGAGSQIGMGKAIALALAKEGCNLVISDIDLAGLEKTATDVKALGVKCLAVKVDVTSREETAGMAAAAIKEYGKIDILVNNAGGTSFSGTLVEAKDEDLGREINLNLYGVLNCTKAVLPNMLENKYGKIVSISSLAGRRGLAGGSGYSAAKEGVLGMTKAVAKEVGPSNININAIAPGLVMTNFYGGEGFPKLPPEMQENSKNNTPMRRASTVEDVANAVVFLVSDVSKNITGQTLSVDGGAFMI